MRPQAAWKVMIQAPRISGRAASRGAAHLARGLVREGDGEDLVRLRAARADQVRDPVGEHARLAGAGAGDHEQRAFRGEDGLALGGVQVGEVALGRGDCHVVDASGGRRAAYGALSGNGLRASAGNTWAVTHSGVVT